MMFATVRKFTWSLAIATHQLVVYSLVVTIRVTAAKIFVALINRDLELYHKYRALYLCKD